MVNKNGYLKLVDFGMAKRLSSKKKNLNDITKTYTICGTDYYIV